MIGRTLLLISLILGFAIAVAMPASAQTPGSPPPPPQQQPSPPAHACPPGTHWEEAGYVAHGKWRAARCARDNGRE